MARERGDAGCVAVPWGSDEQPMVSVRLGQTHHVRYSSTQMRAWAWFGPKSVAWEGTRRAMFIALGLPSRRISGAGVAGGRLAEVNDDVKQRFLDSGRLLRVIFLYRIAQKGIARAKTGYLYAIEAEVLCLQLGYGCYCLGGTRSDRRAR